MDKSNVRDKKRPCDNKKDIIVEDFLTDLTKMSREEGEAHTVQQQNTTGEFIAMIENIQHDDDDDDDDDKKKANIDEADIMISDIKQFYDEMNKCITGAATYSSPVTGYTDALKKRTAEMSSVLGAAAAQDDTSAAATDFGLYIPKIAFGISFPRKQHRIIAAVCLAGKFSDNPRQFISAWGGTIDGWAKCDVLVGTGCPCCYLCRLLIVPGSSEMEHVVPCPVAFRHFPNMDILRLYYPHILLHESANMGEYMEKTSKRCSPAGSGQSLRADSTERTTYSGLSMLNLWTNFTTIQFDLLWNLYMAINCGVGDADALMDQVKTAFMDYVISKCPGFDDDKEKMMRKPEGAFQRIFNFGFAVIKIWLLEFAYSHKWCNQTKLDSMFHLQASCDAIREGGTDAHTGKTSRINAGWSNDVDVNGEWSTLGKQPMIDAFKLRLTATEVDTADGIGRSLTQLRVLQVWDAYYDAIEQFRKVTVEDFTNDVSGSSEIAQVFQMMNICRLFKFTNLSDYAGLRIEGSSTSSSVSGVVVSVLDVYINEEHCGRTTFPIQVDNDKEKRKLTKEINLHSKAIVSATKTLDQLQDDIATWRNLGVDLPDRIKERFFKTEIEIARITEDINQHQSNIDSKNGKINILDNKFASPTKAAGGGEDFGGGARRVRKSKSKSKRTRRARKSKRKSKRTRRVRKSSKSSRKKKTRRRSKK